MTWTPTLDILADLGVATASPLWLPILVWTILALPLWAFLERTDRLHPLAEYRLSQALLFTLPLSLVAAGLPSLLSTPPPVDAVIVVPRAALPAVEVPASQAVETTAREVTRAPAWTWMQALGLLTVLGLAGAAVQLGRFALDALAVVRVRASVEEPPSESLQARVQQMAEQLDVGRSVRVRLVPSAVVPITLGGVRPTILLPPGLAEQDDALRMTLCHELIHIRRYDDLAHLVERFVAALFAAHPLVGRLRSHVEAVRERACDAAVLRDGQTSSAAYARLLVAFAERNPRSGRLGALSLSESPSSLTDRIDAMCSTMPRWLSSPLSLGLSLIAVGLGLTVGVAACTDNGMSSSSDATSATAVLDSGESVWTPIEDARAVGDEWLTNFNEGNAKRSYEGATPMTESMARRSGRRGLNSAGRRSAKSSLADTCSLNPSGISVRLAVRLYGCGTCWNTSRGRGASPPW